MALRRLAHYEILEQVGRGAMGVVLKAWDTRLDRTVAIKILPPVSGSDPERRNRFFTEARAAARLNHPSIATVHEVGEAEVDDPELAPQTEGTGTAVLPYIVMEYVEGADLTNEIGSGLPMRRVLTYAIQIAEALEAAHAMGVIHRDLKPQNIRVGAARNLKILDFGLAKLLTTQVASDYRAAPVPHLTAAGMIVGTIPYIAPEVVDGRPADPRGDLFSLGVVLYELTTGRLPFPSRSLVEYAKAVHGEPEPITQSRPDSSPELARIVGKLLQPDPADRYQSAHDVATDLKSLARSESSLHPVVEPIRPPTGRRSRWRATAAGATLVVVVVVVLLLLRFPPGGSPGGNIQNVTVLPISNQTDDPSMTYYYEGISSFLISQLSKVPGLNVVSWLDARAYRDTIKRPQEIARELDVGSLISGIVRGTPGKLQISITLNDPAQHAPVWEESFEGSREELPLLTEKIAERVMERLPLSLSAEERNRLRLNPARSVEVHEPYLRAQHILESERDDVAELTEAARLFRQAVDRGADFAPARAGLSEALLRSYQQTGARALLEEAEEEAREAVRLDPDLPSARIALAAVYRVWGGRYDESIAELQAVLKQNPRLDEAHLELARTYDEAGRPELARQSFERAIELRPNFWRHWNRLGDFARRTGDYDEARQAFRRAVELAPAEETRPLSNLGGMELEIGNPDAAAAAFDGIAPDKVTAQVASNRGLAHFLAGHFQQAAESFRLATELSPSRPVGWGNLGDAQSELGKVGDARASYLQALELTDGQLRDNPNNPTFRSRRILYLAKAGECATAIGEAEALEADEAAQQASVTRRLAGAYATCGETEQALAALRRTIEMGTPGDVLRGDYELRSLANDPRFQELVGSTG